MKRHQHQDKEVDEHNAPTEPLPRIQPLSPNSATIAGGIPADSNEIIPMPTPYDRPFPYQSKAPPNPTYRPPGTPVYPVLPPASPVYPVVPDRPIQTADVSTRESSVPLLVGMFFVAIQLLLLARFVLKLLNLSGSGGTTWIAIIYTFGSIFVLPFRLLLQNINLSLPPSIEIYTLLAILIYGLFSRILVHLLKAVLHSR